jgi:hypothetical protein
MFTALVVVVAMAFASACLAATASNAYIYMLIDDLCLSISSYIRRTLFFWNNVPFHPFHRVYLDWDLSLAQFKQGCVGLIQTARPRGAGSNVLSQACSFADLRVSGCSAAAVMLVNHA